MNVNCGGQRRQLIAANLPAAGNANVTNNDMHRALEHLKIGCSCFRPSEDEVGKEIEADDAIASAMQNDVAN